MLDYKGILNYYREGCKTDDELRNKITPFMEFLSYLDTAGEMLKHAEACCKAIPDDFGLKELRWKVADMSAVLDEFSGDSVIEDMKNV